MKTKARIVRCGLLAFDFRLLKQRPSFTVTFADRSTCTGIHTIMSALTLVDLSTDPAAERVVKDEAVEVAFATAAGELMSLEGPNRYAPGDALITGATGERWVVSRERFDAKYLPEGGIAHGEAGVYRNRPAVVLARQMREAFSIARSNAGDILSGAAGDWVMQYAPGDYGVVKAARFAKVYRRAG
jgi:PGDYG protein